MSNVKYLIIGGGYTGGSAAEALRQLDPHGSILLVGGEKELPYRRYTLNKQYLRDERTRDRMPLHPASYYLDSNIEVRSGVRAVALNVERREVQLDDGGAVAFDRLLLATGAVARHLTLPGVDMPGVYYLRTIEDSDRLKKEMQPGRRALIIGGGFIGPEVGASFTQKGLRVTLVERGPILWARLFGDEMGRFFEDALRSRGIDIRTSCEVQRLEGNRRVERAILSDGNVVPCDFVVIGVGVHPETALAEAAGLKVKNGIVVDEFLQTSTPGIFAGGDAARFYHPVFREPMRIEHWNVAGQHGSCAARNMAGQPTAYREVPDFFSDVFDLSIEWLGYGPAWEQVIVRRLEPEKLSAFYLKDGRITGALLVNNGTEIQMTREMIERRTVFHDPKALRDTGLDMARLAS